uniref:Uncharacterized protein n=1 Tax=Oryza sativa subsp. japonica TaxID=39947 RepID=Q7F235_ORYSJ|nr:hypothetical protein [Oryza sativa Japonica Group]BAD30219.1 hypothetical protein [Oryza sativa Japonica Group]
MVVVVTVDSVSSSLDSSTTGAGSTSSEHPRPPEHRHQSHHCLHEPPHCRHPSSSPLPSVGRKEEAPDLLPVTPSPRAVDAESHQHRFRGLVALDPPSQGPPTPDPPSRGPPAPYPLPRTSPLVDAATVEAMAAGGSGKGRPEKGGRRRDRGTSERRVWWAMDFIHLKSFFFLQRSSCRCLRSRLQYLNGMGIVGTRVYVRSR